MSLIRCSTCVSLANSSFLVAPKAAITLCSGMAAIVAPRAQPPTTAISAGLMYALRLPWLAWNTPQPMAPQATT